MADGISPCKFTVVEQKHTKTHTHIHNFFHSQSHLLAHSFVSFVCFCPVVVHCALCNVNAVVAHYYVYIVNNLIFVSLKIYSFVLPVHFSGFYRFGQMQSTITCSHSGRYFSLSFLFFFFSLLFHFLFSYTLFLCLLSFATFCL